MASSKVAGPPQAPSSIVFPSTSSNDAEPGPSQSVPPSERTRIVTRSMHAREPSKYRRHYRTASGNLAFGRQAKRRADARARIRFLKALAFGTFVWLLFAFALAWIGINALRGGRQPVRGRPLPPPPSDGTVVKCANYSDVGEVASADSLGYDLRHTTPSKSRSPILQARPRHQTRFDIVLNDGALFFLHGSGPYGQGSVKFVVEDDADVDVQASKKGSRVAKITVTPVTTDARLLTLVNVCHMAAEDGSSAGIGVYANLPDNGIPDESKLSFDIVATLPQTLIAQNAAEPAFAAIEVRGPSWDITAKGLARVDTDRIDFETKVGSMDLHHIRAREVRARTAVGDVSGHFKVGEYLSLTTNDGDIEASVALMPPPTDTSRSTSVHVSAAAGDIDLSYTEHPANLTLNSYASANSGKVVVTHQPAFEGDFELETTWGKALLVGPREEAKDPAGLERRRVKEIRKSHFALGYSHVVGTVWWANPNNPEEDKNRRERGTSKVETVAGDGTLNLA